MKNEETIKSFYLAFAQMDADKMVVHYHPNIVFSDPAFGELIGEEVCDMWRMLISKGGDELLVELLSVVAHGDQVNAKWKASYKYGKKGRPVVNEVSARFELEDGKIVRQWDDFDLWKWAGQAMGIKGKVMGWTKFFKRKVQNTTKRQLAKYRLKTES